MLNIGGIAGSVGPSLGASSIGDMFAAEERGRAQSLYSFGPVMGPVLGGLFGRAITRPIRLLFTSPICAFISIYLSLFYGILYLHLITIILLFGLTEMYGLYLYHWINGTTGLAYLRAGSSSLLGMAITGKYMNKPFASALARQEKRTGSSTPTSELRLSFMQIGMAIVLLGLIMFAWSAGRAYCTVPLLGASIFGSGMLMVYVCIHTYLVDCFGKWAASALAAEIATRRLGYDWGLMLLAFLCIAMMPIPFGLQKYGSVLREKQINS
ncbi:hypothetical protein TruAng_012230 [Truncatella angustata]|nr:hypothetical protein TruAng_012230 [Truncatella angustata]